MGLGDVVQLAECFLVYMKAWSTPGPHKLAVAVHNCFLSTWEVEAGGSGMRALQMSGME